jgi:ABC-2 type transport system ATP-binding protein
MIHVHVDHVSKSYNDVEAVRDATFDVGGGGILALLGPNGAGKTTLIRMMMGILRPDKGRIDFNGFDSSDVANHVGYLPEERGLYKRQRVLEVLEYFGSLKGLGIADARTRARSYLERLGLADVEQKKIEALSKGMQQKVQIIATLLHGPLLVVLDEPMSGLDPVNARLVRDLILEEKQQGRAIMLSTHQMFHAEALADTIVMINHGRIVLNDARTRIQQQYSEGAVLLDRHTRTDDLAVVATREDAGDHVKVRLRSGATPKDLMAELVARDRVCEHFEVATTPLEDIFIQLVKETPA